jgi:hypothetical protein
MIEVTSIKVGSYDLDHLDIFWELDSQDQERIEEYDFYLLRSIDGAAGPYHRLAGPFYNTFRFRDNDVHRLHKWRQYYYRLRLIHRPTGHTKEFGPQWLQAAPDRIALEIQRRETLLFKEFAGRVVYHFPQLTFGQRCKHCWDRGPRGNTIARSVQQNCATCFDTTFVGGFARPMAIHMQIDPSPITPQRTDLKEHQFIVTTARTTMFPPVQPKDMIVENENRRWSVEQVSFTEKNRMKIRQELRLREYPRDDIKYAVPVAADIREIHTPERELTRPMSLQSRQPEPVDDRLQS